MHCAPASAAACQPGLCKQVTTEQYKHCIEYSRSPQSTTSTVEYSRLSEMIGQLAGDQWDVCSGDVCMPGAAKE